MKSTTSLLRLAAVAGLLLTASSVYANTAYTQPFSLNSGTDINASTVFWYGLVNSGASGAVNASSTSDTTANNAVPLIGSSAGKDPGVNGLTSLNLAALPSSSPAGLTAAANSNQALYYTSTSNFNPGFTSLTFASLTSASWWQGHTSANATTAIAVQLGGQWYVADSFNTNPAVQFASGFASGAQQKTTNFQSVTWTKLNFQTTAATATYGTGANGGNASATAFAFGTTTDAGIAASTLASLSVNSIGWFNYAPDADAARLRFDSFTVTAVPEPSSVAAIIGLGALGLAANRHRRRRQAAKA